MIAKYIICIFMLVLVGGIQARSQGVQPPPLVGYSLQTLQPADQPTTIDTTTYFFGCGSGFTPTAGVSIHCFIPKAGVVRAVYGIFRNLTPGTGENSVVSFRLNDTTDTLISSTVVNNATLTTFSSTGLAIVVSQGDFFDLKMVTPVWVTNPGNVRMSSTVWVERVFP